MQVIYEDAFYEYKAATDDSGALWLFQEDKGWQGHRRAVRLPAPALGPLYDLLANLTKEVGSAANAGVGPRENR